MQQLKWAVLGAGDVARRRAMPAINKAENGKLFAILSRAEERAKRIAEEYGAERYYTDVDELLSDEDIDAIYISTPPYLHCEHVIKAAEKGLDIVCDKPMAINPIECEKMIDVCEANRVALQICFLFRFHSCFKKIKKWIVEGKLGNVVQARMPILKYSPREEDSWRRDLEKSGGGSIMDVGAHSIDLMRYVVGSEVTEVSAFCSNNIFQYETEDTGMVMMKFENQAFAFTDTSFATPACNIVFEVYGTEGSVIVYNDDGWKIKTFFDSEWSIEPSQYEDLYQFQFEHFARYLKGEEKAIVTGIDGLKTSQIIKAAYESNKKGKTIKIS